MSRVYCANGKQYLYPQVIAGWSANRKGCFLEETLISVLGADGDFLLKRTMGYSTPVWKIFSPRVTRQRTQHQAITESEAKAWLEAHLPENLAEECLNDWPFKKEGDNNDQSVQ